MFIQLGNYIFDKAFTPDSISHTDETTYAEHALIGIKPRLQPVGNNLEEITLGIRLRSELVNVQTTYKNLKRSKDEFEVLPYLYGTGEYRGDYVITSLTHAPIFTLADGFTVEMQLSITLKEYQVADKLQQQQNAARKNAFAVGKIQPARITPAQLKTNPQVAVTSIGLAASHSAVIDNQVRSYQNNVSQQASIASKIESGLNKLTTALDTAKEKIDTITGIVDIAAVIGRIAQVKETAGNFVFPPTDIDLLITTNRDLQASMRGLKKSSIPITNLVLTRSF